MTFKKIVALIALSFLLLSCAPAQASPAEIPATEIPATEAPVATKEIQPTPIIQREGEITFEYHLTNVLPEEFFGGTYVKSEKISYYREGTTWPIKNSSLKVLDLGPLFQVERLESLSNKIGTCGINTYPEENTFPIQFQPHAASCGEILGNETASITFGLSGCDTDIQKNIICSKTTLNGTLYYKLNKELDTFLFNYTGFWSEGEYPSWINQALTTLGFPETPKAFFENPELNKNYTIYKNSGE